MKRRDFLMAASGVAGGTAAGAAVPAAAQDDGDTTTASENETTTAAEGTTEGGESGEGEASGDGGGSGGGGGTEEVVVGPGGSVEFDPAELTITPGTTVLWTWDSDNHNVVADSVPEGASWEGTEGGDDETYDTGHEYEHTFDTEGEYAYYCTPHQQAGMTGTISVQQNTGTGEVEEDPEHMGVPIQAHFVGIGTILMIIVSLVYTFFTLKYGESPHTSGGNR